MSARDLAECVTEPTTSKWRKLHLASYHFPDDMLTNRLTVSQLADCDFLKTTSTAYTYTRFFIKHFRKMTSKRLNRMRLPRVGLSANRPVTLVPLDTDKRTKTMHLCPLIRFYDTLHVLLHDDTLLCRPLPLPFLRADLVRLRPDKTHQTRCYRQLSKRTNSPSIWYAKTTAIEHIHSKPRLVWQSGNGADHINKVKLR